jgi:hypothetical protein
LLSKPKAKARKMAFDPEELATLTNHGTMKLRSAVPRAIDLTTGEAHEGNHRPKWQTGDPEIRADQRSCGRVGETARTL